jgi:hypothetical protein
MPAYIRAARARVLSIDLPDKNSSMTPPDLIIEDRDSYLFVEYSGDPLTLEMIVATINKVAAVIRSGNVKNVLIMRNAPLLKDDAARMLVASMVRRLVPDDVRFAIVDKYGNDPSDCTHAAEAAQKAGWDLHCFGTTDEAIDWLTK